MTGDRSIEHLIEASSLGTSDPRAEIRERIIRRLNTDEWMNKHFGVSCHAGDIADAVLELFDTVDIEFVRDLYQPTSTRLVLRTALQLEETP